MRNSSSSNKNNNNNSSDSSMSINNSSSSSNISNKRNSSSSRKNNCKRRTIISNNENNNWSSSSNNNNNNNYILSGSCSSFVQLCQLEGQSRERLLDCCPRYFDPVPFFDENAGVCYTAHFDMKPEKALRAYSVRMFLSVSTELTPSKTSSGTTTFSVQVQDQKMSFLELSMFLMGDKVMEKFSPVYALTVGSEHPAAAIRDRPLKSSLDTVNIVGMKKRTVQKSLYCACAKETNNSNLILDRPQRPEPAPEPFERLRPGLPGRGQPGLLPEHVRGSVHGGQLQADGAALRIANVLLGAVHGGAAR